MPARVGLPTLHPCACGVRPGQATVPAVERMAVVTFATKGPLQSAGDSAWASTTQWTCPEDLQSEYRALVAAELARRGVPEDVVQVEVTRLDELPDGRAMYAVFLKVIAWREQPVVALLLGEGF